MTVGNTILIDYYPFGMLMPERTYSAPNQGYRYGFNGMEKDDEVKGAGNSLDFGARIYDGRLGRWLSLDPLQAEYPYESHYVFVSNNPIIYVDPTGGSKWIVHRTVNLKTNETSELWVLSDMYLLEAVEVNVPSKVAPSTLGSQEYDYYDINEVHTKYIKEDGTIINTTTTERGDYRTHTWFKSQYWANVFKTETPQENKMAKNRKLTGIRWTTSSKGAFGQGNNYDDGRTYSRSENIDLLLAVIKFAKSANGNTPKGLTNVPNSLKDVIEKVKAAKKIIDVDKAIKKMGKEVAKGQKYNQDGQGCNSCNNERHDNLDYKDREGNVIDGESGDTIKRDGN